MKLSDAKRLPRFLQAWIDHYALERQRSEQTRAILSSLTPYEKKFVQVFAELNPSETKTFKWLLSHCNTRFEATIQVSSVDLMLRYLSEQVSAADGPRPYLDRPSSAFETPYLIWLNQYLADLAAINAKLRKMNEQFESLQRPTLKQWLVFLAKPVFCGIAASTLFSYAAGYFTGFLQPVSHCEVMEYVNRTLRPEAVKKHITYVVKRIDEDTARYRCKIPRP